MPSWVPRVIVLAFVGLAVFLSLRWMLGQLRGLLTLLLVSLFLAFAIEPAVNWLSRRGMRRGLATGVVFVVLLLAAGAFVAALGSVIVTEARSIGTNVPHYANEFVDWVNRTFHTELSTERIRDELAHPGGSLSAFTSRLTRNALGYGATVVGAVFQFFTVLLFTFYLSADGPRFRNAVCSLLPPQWQREVQRAWDIAVDKTGGYLYSRALLAALSAVAHYVALRAIGVPFALALAVWVGIVSQFVPTIGTYLAAGLPVVVALANRPIDALWVALLAIAYQQVENYLLHPRITAHTLSMHPAVAFGSIIAGAALLGPVGALLALPAVATLLGFLGEYVRRYEVTETTETRGEREKRDGRKRGRGQQHRSGQDHGGQKKSDER